MYEFLSVGVPKVMRRSRVNVLLVFSVGVPDVVTDDAQSCRLLASCVMWFCYFCLICIYWFDYRCICHTTMCSSMGFNVDHS